MKSIDSLMQISTFLYEIKISNLIGLILRLPLYRLGHRTIIYYGTSCEFRGSLRLWRWVPEKFYRIRTRKK